MVTKGSGKYFFENDRVWREAEQTGGKPELIGKWYGRYQPPDPLTKDAVKALAQGTPTQRTNKNRVGGYDVTFTFDKSVSIVTYGLTKPSEWGAWSKEFAQVVKDTLEPRLAAQVAKFGAQGKEKVPSQGVAALFPHWSNRWGDVNAHVHGFTPNVTTTPDRRVGSIGNARDTLYREQGEMRAEANKRMDDVLRDKGFSTYRRGNVVAVTGVPEKMVRELSPAREAMARAREATGNKDGPKSPRAEDFVALSARREAGPDGRKATPEEAHTQCLAVAAKHGVTLESLRGSSPKADRDASRETYAAYELAIKARDVCEKQYGSFTPTQFRERLYTLAIGEPVTLPKLQAMATVALENPKVMGIGTTKGPDGQARHFTEKTTETVKEAERPFVRDAWNELKRAGKGLGEAVFIATAKKATEVLERVKAAFVTEPVVVRVDAARLNDFIKAHKPTNYVVAHAKASLAMTFTWGNPHERAAAGERVYQKLRAFERLPSKSVVVVERGDQATPAQLAQLNKIAKRDGSSVILSERADPNRAYARPQSPPHKERETSQERRGPAERSL